MARERQSFAWDHTSALMTTMLNMFRKPDEQLQPFHFNAFRKAGKVVKRELSEAENKANFAMMKRVFVDRDFSGIPGCN